MVTPKGISPDPGEVRVVEEFLTPTNLKIIAGVLLTGFLKLQVR